VACLEIETSSCFVFNNHLLRVLVFGAPQLSWVFLAVTLSYIPNTYITFKARFGVCHFDETIFKPLGGKIRFLALHFMSISCKFLFCIIFCFHDAFFFLAFLPYNFELYSQHLHHL
jgi:hypothetical protein